MIYVVDELHGVVVFQLLDVVLCCSYEVVVWVMCGGIVSGRKVDRWMCGCGWCGCVVMFFDLFGKHFVGNKKRASIKKLKIFLFPYISYGFMSSKLYNPTSCSICCCASLRH